MPARMGGVNFQDISQDLENAIKDSSALRSVAASAANPLATMADAGSIQKVSSNFFNLGALTALAPLIVPTGFTPQFLHVLIGSYAGGGGNPSANISVGIATTVADQAYVQQAHWQGGSWGASFLATGQIGRTQNALTANITEWTLTQMDATQIQLTFANINTGCPGDFAKITVLG